MNIYLAARYSRIDELNGYAEQLRDLGHTITSRWLGGTHQFDDRGLSVEAAAVERRRFAKEDYTDVVRSRCVISFTEPPRSAPSRGARHVEYGIALARDLRCIVVGPRENVFHHLEEVEVYETWEQCLRVLTPSPHFSPTDWDYAQDAALGRDV